MQYNSQREGTRTTQVELFLAIFLKYTHIELVTQEMLCFVSLLQMPSNSTREVHILPRFLINTIRQLRISKQAIPGFVQKCIVIRLIINYCCTFHIK